MIYPAKLAFATVVRTCGLDNVEKAIAMRSGGSSWDAIKVETGLNNRHLSSILPLAPKKITNRLSDTTVGNILKMRREGFSYPEIARVVGVGAQTPRKICRKWFDDWELERTRRLASRKRFPESPESRLLKYATIKNLRGQGLSHAKIGKIVGMSKQGVASVISLHGDLDVEEVVASHNRTVSRFRAGADPRRDHKAGCNCPVCRIRVKQREVLR